jgi:hypothetical protein
MAAKKYEVIIDVNSGSVKIAGGEMLSLNQQVRILQKELGNVDGKEFELLSGKLNETKDKAQQVNARSRELFSTLSLLPGPIGLFAGKIDGAISLMKVFSGFKLADIRAQFVALGADIAEIGKRLFAATGLQKIFQVTSTATAAVLRAVGIQATAASVGVRAFSTALVATGVGALVVGLGYLVTAFMNSKDAGEKYEEQLKRIREEQDRVRTSTENYYEREIANAKALGASDIELQRLRIKGLQDVYDQAQKNYLQTYNARIDAEYFNKQAVKALKEDEDAKFKIVTDYEQKLALATAELRNTERLQQEAAKKKTLDDAKALADAQKRQRLEQLNAEIAVERAKDNRDRASQDKLRKLILERILLEKEGIRMTAEIKQAASDEAQRQVEEEVQRDVDAYEKGLEQKREANQKFIDDELRDLRAAQREKEDYYEFLKSLYGEDSFEALTQYQVVITGRRELIRQESSLLVSYQRSVEGLSRAQKDRLVDLIGDTKSILQNNTQFTEQLGKNLGQYGKTIEEAFKNIDDLRKAQLTKDLKEIEGRKKILLEEFSWQEDGIVTFRKRLEIIKELQGLEAKERTIAINSTEEANKKKKSLIEQEVTDVQKANAAIIASDQQCTDQQNQIQENFIEQQKKYNTQYSQIVLARAQFNNEIVQSVAGTMQNIASFIFDLAGKNKKAQKAAVVIDKAASIGRIISETAVANAKAVATSPLTAGQPWVALNTASAVASTLSVIGGAIRAIREIDTTSTEIGTRSGVINVIARRAMGGIVTGAGTSRSDSIPTLLSNGEFVINANASRMFAPILSQLNSLGNAPQFDMGSLLTQAIGNTTLTSVMAEEAENRTGPIIKTYVSATDMTNQQQMDRMIKSRSTI